MNRFKLYFLCFLFYSFLGWVYEVLLGIFVFHLGFVNRGFLFGPYCPVYGFGALAIIFMLERFRTKSRRLTDQCLSLVVLFLLVMLITTGIELVTSYIMEAAIGEWLWDYEHYSFNFEGRIALSPSLRFGIGGIFFLYVQPVLEKGLRRLPPRVFQILFWLLFVLFAVDCMLRPFLGSNFSA